MLKYFAILALLSVSLASAKTFPFTISIPAQAGSARLKPGEYSLKVNGSRAELMDRNGHRIDAAAKVEVAGRKFDQTIVSISKVAGRNRIQSIALGGSKDRVVFEP